MVIFTNRLRSVLISILAEYIISLQVYNVCWRKFKKLRFITITITIQRATLLNLCIICHWYNLHTSKYWHNFISLYNLPMMTEKGTSLDKVAFCFEQYNKSALIIRISELKTSFWNYDFNEILVYYLDYRFFVLLYNKFVFPNLNRW